MMSGTIAIGAGAGMPLSAIVVASADWRAIFWVTAGLGLVFLLACWRFLRESPVRKGGLFDFRSAVVISAGLTAALVALSRRAQWGWTSAATLGWAVTGVLLLAASIPLQLRTTNPLVDVRIAVRPIVLLVNSTAVFSAFAMFGNMLITTYYLQEPIESGYGQGLDIVHTGLWLAPVSLAFGAMAPLSAAVIRRIGSGATLFWSSLLMAAAYAARVYLSGELWLIVVGGMLVSVTSSLTYAAMPTLIMRSVPVTETASANGVNVLHRYLGNAFASVAAGAVASVGLVQASGQEFPSENAMHVLFWMAAGVSCVAAAISFSLLRLSRASRRARPRAPLEGSELLTS